MSEISVEALLRVAIHYTKTTAEHFEKVGYDAAELRDSIEYFSRLLVWLIEVRTWETSSRAGATTLDDRRRGPRKPTRADFDPNANYGRA